MKCEICGAETTVHVTDLQTDGTSVERHLCEVHAREAGMPVPSTDHLALAMVPKLRSLARFIRSNNRMPTRDEIQQLGAFGDLTHTLPGTADFDRQLMYLENSADFTEKNRRFPTEEEMPDPF
jgi:hypothetical protein